jgi:hypothetical protein
MTPIKKGFILTMGGLATMAATTIFPLLGWLTINATIAALDHESEREQKDARDRESLANWHAAELGLAEHGFTAVAAQCVPAPLPDCILWSKADGGSSWLRQTDENWRRARDAKIRANDAAHNAKIKEDLAVLKEDFAGLFGSGRTPPRDGARLP